MQLMWKKWLKIGKMVIPRNAYDVNQYARWLGDMIVRTNAAMATPLGSPLLLALVLWEFEKCVVVWKKSNEQFVLTGKTK